MPSFSWTDCIYVLASFSHYLLCIINIYIYKMSNKFSIIILKPNDVFKPKLSVSNIKNELKQYLLEQNIVETIYTNIEDVPYELYTRLNLSADVIGESCVIYEDTNYIYQLFNHPMQEKIMSQDIITKPLNYIATVLAKGIHFKEPNKSIYGDVIIIRSKIKQTNYTCEIADMDLELLVEVLSKKIKHVGLFIETTGSMIEWVFSNNPMENITEDNKDNFACVGFKLIDFEFVCYFQKKFYPESVDNELNKIGTLLLSTHLVYGDIILCQVTNNNFDDIDSDTLSKILLYLSSKESTRENEINNNYDNLGNNMETKEKIDGLYVVKNRYINLVKKLKNFKVICHGANCSNHCTQSICCDYCGIAYYHSLECKKKNMLYHKKICLVEKIQNAIINKSN